MYAMRTPCSEAKRHNLELKTQPKQLLSTLPLDITLSRQIKPNGLSILSLVLRDLFSKEHLYYNYNYIQHESLSINKFLVKIIKSILNKV